MRPVTPPARRHDLRPLNAPTPIRVNVDENGQPSSVTRAGRSTHAVAAIQDRWRIDDEWWREHAISRMYYTLLLDDDSLLNVYHDLIANAWHEQRG
jgi:hypothetical protein